MGEGHFFYFLFLHHCMIEYCSCDSAIWVVSKSLQFFCGVCQSQLLSFPACVPSGGNSRRLRLKMLRRRLLSKTTSAQVGGRRSREPVGASSVQRPSSCATGETLGIFGGRVSPQLGKGGRNVHNTNSFSLLVTGMVWRKLKFLCERKKRGVVSKK